MGVGLIPGDVIYDINNVPIYSIEILNSTIANIKSHNPVVLLMKRSGELQYVCLPKIKKKG